MTRNVLRIASLTAILLPSPTLADTHAVGFPSITDWSAPATWLENQVPTSSHNAFLPTTGGPYIVAVNQDAAAHSIYIAGLKNPQRDVLLSVGNAATVSVTELLSVAYTSSAYGSLSINGAGSAVSIAGDLAVASGLNSVANLNITSGAHLTTTGSFLGGGVGSYASCTVSGPGSSWTSSGNLYVGLIASGSVNISSGAHVAAGNAYVGMSDFSNVNLTGPGSLLDVAGELIVGGGFADGNSVEAHNDAAVAVHGNLTVYSNGSLNFYHSSLTVDGLTSLPSGPVALLDSSSATLDSVTGDFFSSLYLATGSALTAKSVQVATFALDASHATLTPSATPSSATHLVLLHNATLDLTSNAFTTTATPADIRPLLQTNQITSSLADAAHRIGYLVSGNSITMKLTLAGDTNLDGLLNADDYARLDKGNARHGTTWSEGDFNYDGSVTPADYLVIDTTLLQQGGHLSPDLLAARESQFGSQYVATLLTSIPEPGAVLTALSAAFLSLPRRASRAPRRLPHAS